MTSLADQFAADAEASKAAPPSVAQQFAADAGTPPKAAEATRAEQPGIINSIGNARNGALLHMGTGLLGSVVGGWHGIGSAASSLMNGGSVDDAVNAGVETLNHDRDALTYNPPASSSAAKAVSALESKYSPLTWPEQAGGFLGNKAQDAGASPEVATAVDVGTQFIPQLLGLKGGAITRGARALPLRDLLKSAPEAVRVEPTLSIQPGAIADNPSPTLSQIAPGVPEQSMTLAPQDSVPGKSAPFQVAATEAPKPSFSDPKSGVFAESSPDQPGGISPAEQQRRAQILNEVGLSQVRRSAVTGDTNQAAVDFQTSRLKGSPSGDAMSQQLAGEKQAISQYADNIAQKTGGSSLNDQAAKLSRGETILTPFEGLKEWFDNQTSALYKTADERAQGVPTQLENFRTVLGDDSLATNQDRVHLRTAIGSYARQLGIIGDDGSVFSNAQQAETIRKYLNDNWSPQNSGLVGKLKDAIDNDVMQSAGEDVYGQARALRAQRAQTLDNPNGVARLLDSSGPQGVNRAVPVERVADSITNLPVAQLSNIVQTLRNMPPELQPMAADALAEIKAQYAHNVKDIGASQQGQWYAKGVQKYLSNNSARMATVFEPDEMQSFGTLNDAGNILAKDQSYPGAFAQKQNLLRAGVTHAITSGSTAAGGFVGGPVGGVVGNVLGSKLAGKYNDAATLKATQKRMVNVSDLLPKNGQ